MWGNGVKQIVKTTPDDSPYGAIVKPDGQRNGVKLEGTNGWIWVNRSTIEASDQAMLDTPMENPAVRLEVSDDHMGNFFAAVRSRKDPVSPVESGHRSAVVGHLIVIALRTGTGVEMGSGQPRPSWGRARPRRTSIWRERCASRTTTASGADGPERFARLVECPRHARRETLGSRSRSLLQHLNAVTPEAFVVAARRCGPPLTRGLSRRFDREPLNAPVQSGGQVGFDHVLVSLPF